MSTIINARDVILQATTPRMVSVTLDTNIVVPAVKAITLSAPSPVFQVNTSGTASPTSIVLTATNRQVTGTITWSVTSGTATLTSTTGVSPASATLTYANLGSASATIRASVTEGATTYTADFTIAKVVDGAAGSAGANGAQNALIYIHQRAATAPTLPSAVATYTFATATLTGLNNGWTQTVPAGSNPLYVSAATASNLGTTDAIPPSEWAAAVILAQDGAAGTNGTNGAAGTNGTNGAAGINAATVYLFQRNTTGVAPSVSSTTATYTFATGGLSGHNNGWSQTMPTTGGIYRWMTTATALGTGTTDTIGTAEWAAPAILAQDGVDGTAATRTGILDMYLWSAGAPASFPSGSSTYTWATGQFTAPATPNGWALTPGAAVLGQTLYICRQVYTDTLATTTSSVTWSASTSRPLGAAGVNGARTAFLELYQWAASVPTVFPTGTASTYTWATGAFTLPGTPNSWSLLPGAPVAGQTLWACGMVFSDSLTTATSSVSWTTSVAYPAGYAGNNGTNGAAGARGSLTGAGVNYGITSTAWDDGLAQRVIRNMLQGESFTTSYTVMTSPYTLVTDLVRIGDTVTLQKSPPWVRTRGTYSATAYYASGDVVIYSGAAYRCRLAGVGQTPSTSSTYWVQVYSAVAASAAWAISTAYFVQDATHSTSVVTANGFTWLALYAHTSGASSLALDQSLKWIPTAGVWSGTVPYSVDDIVIASGTSYICIQASLNNTPSSSATYWASLTTVSSRGNWAASTVYFANDYAVYPATTGVTHIAMYQHTSGADFTADLSPVISVFTRFWNGGAWVTVGQVLDGNLLIKGSVSADAIYAYYLSALSALLGNVTIDQYGSIKGGQTAYNTGTGFFLGYSGSAYKFSIGTSTAGMTWDGTAMSIKGDFKSGTGNEFQVVGGVTSIIGGFISVATVGNLADPTKPALNAGVTAGSAQPALKANVATGTGYAIDVTGNTSSPAMQVTAGAPQAAINAAGRIVAAASAGDATLSGSGSGSTNGVRGNNSTASTSGLVGAANGYNFYADGGASGSFDYGTFTGAHDALMTNVQAEAIEVGDIVVDYQVLGRHNASNHTTEVQRSSSANQKGVVGVFAGFSPAELGNEFVPNGLRSKTWVQIVTLAQDYKYVVINALGEGDINVCGAGGDIDIGDLIVASNKPGKGQRQADDILRGCTVAKAREKVTFSSPAEEKTIACIYVAG